MSFFHVQVMKARKKCPREHWGGNGLHTRLSTRIVMLTVCKVAVKWLASYCCNYCGPIANSTRYPSHNHAVPLELCRQGPRFFGEIFCVNSAWQFVKFSSKPRGRSLLNQRQTCKLQLSKRVTIAQETPEFQPKTRWHDVYDPRCIFTTAATT